MKRAFSEDFNYTRLSVTAIDSMRCSFTDMCGFIQGSEDKFDWTTATQATPTANTGPLRGSGEYGKGGGDDLDWMTSNWGMPTDEIAPNYASFNGCGTA